jgi:hypothetical protein
VNIRLNGFVVYKNSDRSFQHINKKYTTNDLKRIKFFDNRFDAQQFADRQNEYRVKKPDFLVEEVFLCDKELADYLQFTHDEYSKQLKEIYNLIEEKTTGQDEAWGDERHQRAKRIVKSLLDKNADYAKLKEEHTLTKWAIKNYCKFTEPYFNALKEEIREVRDE